MKTTASTKDLIKDMGPSMTNVFQDLHTIRTPEVPTLRQRRMAGNCKCTLQTHNTRVNVSRV